MSRRFFSFPGMSHGANSGGEQPLPPGYRGPLPDISDNPQFSEWLKSRSPTSHKTFGVDGYNHFRGDVCRVEGEEHDAAKQESTIWVQRSDPSGSGTYKVTAKPGDGPRQMVITESKRVFE